MIQDDQFTNQISSVVAGLPVEDFKAGIYSELDKKEKVFDEILAFQPRQLMFWNRCSDSNKITNETDMGWRLQIPSIDGTI